mmetsp:Transcript_1724/g.3783  ORF Transcript_1724/g.3783 Transcript_1724/m.3783 type:complete len:217 (+) Transcript_1724:447-1097(+)
MVRRRPGVAASHHRCLLGREDLEGKLDRVQLAQKESADSFDGHGIVARISRHSSTGVIASCIGIIHVRPSGGRWRRVPSHHMAVVVRGNHVEVSSRRLVLHGRPRRGRLRTAGLLLAGKRAKLLEGRYGYGAVIHSEVEGAVMTHARAALDQRRFVLRVSGRSLSDRIVCPLCIGTKKMMILVLNRRLFRQLYPILLLSPFCLLRLLQNRSHVRRR